MTPMGVNNIMHAIRVVLKKYMSMYGCNFCELALIPSQVPLKRARAEFHIDTKINKTIGAEIADKEMIQIRPLMADGIFEFGANL